jgi:hypothetical protein
VSDFQLHRLGMIMKPEPGNPHKTVGVLQPCVAAMVSLLFHLAAGVDAPMSERLLASTTDLSL